MKTKLLSIAILEDDLFYAEYLKQGLKSIHYPFVTNFYTKDQFIDGYKKDKPDLVLMDHYLHNTNGLQVINDLIAQDEDAKVVYISGQKDPDIVLKALKKGVIDYLVKDEDVFRHLKSIILRVRVHKKKVQEKIMFERKMKWMAFGMVAFTVLVTLMYKNY